MDLKSSWSNTIGAGLARDVRTAAAHGDADMSRLHRRRIVNAVAGHGDDFAIGLQPLDDAQFLIGLRCAQISRRSGHA